MAFIRNPDARNDPPLPLLKHLEALRSMLVFAVVSWLGGAIAAGAFTPLVVRWLKSPAADSARFIQGLDFSSGFDVVMSVSIWGGLVIAFPFIAFAILRFVFPALTRKEKVVLLTVIIVGTTLFCGGAALAYSQTLPLVVTAFQKINDWVGLPVTTVRIEGYVSIVFKTILAFGLVFLVPLVIMALGWLGIITSASLRRHRRGAIVLAFVLGMFLTPPDPMSQLMMAIPLCLLYELSVWVVRIREGAFGR